MSEAGSSRVDMVYFPFATQCRVKCDTVTNTKLTQSKHQFIIYVVVKFAKM